MNSKLSSTFLNKNKFKNHPRNLGAAKMTKILTNLLKSTEIPHHNAQLSSHRQTKTKQNVTSGQWMIAVSCRL